MIPLAERVRPDTITDFSGQQHLLSEGLPLRRLLAGEGGLHSMILWGPPGSGKTTLARLLATAYDSEFVAMSAVRAGVAEIRAAADRAKQRQDDGAGSVLFLDEIHRFNKSQQDSLLPLVEHGTLILIGATTENPSFALNNALLSRLRLYVLRALPSGDLHEILRRACRYAAPERELSDETLQVIVEAADGDARRALNALEMALADGGDITAERLTELMAGGAYRLFDKGGDIFYDQISAMHKSVRGSAPDAALYWLIRLLDGGCDPLYVARRLVRIASEDIGNADPRALRLALDAWEAQERLGTPEGNLALGQAILYLSCVPKSNAVYKAWQQASTDAQRSDSPEVPIHLRNAPTGLARRMGHGRKYRYAHDEPDAYAAGENYMPDELAGRTYYQPVPRGLEARIAERLAELRRLDTEAGAKVR